MKIAKELGKSVTEVLEFSVLEIQLWSAYYKLEYEHANKGMNGRAGKSRNSRR